MCAKPDKTNAWILLVRNSPATDEAERLLAITANQELVYEIPSDFTRFLHSQLLAQELPVISVDTKKKELVGNFSNGGQEWRPQGEPEQTWIHDFADKELGKVVPYGIYDIGRNQAILPRLSLSECFNNSGEKFISLITEALAFREVFL